MSSTVNGLKERIQNVLRRHFFKDKQDLVDVSDGPGDSVHVVVVSRKFDGKRLREKNAMIWNVLEKHLKPVEWGKISLSIGASPEEIKAH